MACLNDIKWRILNLLWASLDVARLPDEVVTNKEAAEGNVLYNTGKVSR